MERKEKNRRMERDILAVLAIFLLIGAGLMTHSARAAASKTVLLNVPFTSQAPLGEWGDIRQQDGCEEASAAMAMAWVGNEKNISKENWRLRILILSTFENKKYHEFRDISAKDVVAWLFNDYFHYKKVALKPVTGASDIVSELEKGNIVITPMNGRALGNPYFTAPGPERHMLLIKGYDYNTKEFITNDPGTRRGEGYRYSEETIVAAIRDYKTGSTVPIGPVVKDMIVVSK